MATLTRLPDPGGSPVGSVAFTLDLSFDPTGKWLAHVVTTGGNSTRLTWYRRDGATLVRMPDPPARVNGIGQGNPWSAKWSPDSQFLVVGCLPNFNDPTSTAQDSLGRLPGARLWVYRRSGNTLTTVGPAPIATSGIAYAGYGRGFDFDTSGGWLALTNAYGWVGLVRFDTHTGHMSVTHTQNSVTTGQGGTLAWHPTDPTLLARARNDGRIELWRRNNTVLQKVGGPYPAQAGTLMRWHPGGKLLVTDQSSGFGGGGGDGLRAYAYPGMNVVGRWDSQFPNVVRGFSFDPTGAFLAGGPAYNGDATDANNILGLSVAAITVNPTNSDAKLVPRLTKARGQLSGQYTTWAKDGSTLYLVAGGVGTADPFFTNMPFGFGMFKASAQTSTLYQVQPDGSVPIVGLDANATGVQLPDGTYRMWPGSDQPLYQCNPDGEWVQVIG